MPTLDKLRDLQPTKKAFSLLEEFKNFALKGNVIDLAIGVIMGVAFGGLVKSLVDNIIMPIVSLVLPGDQGYKSWAITIGSGTKPITVGLFLADIVNFLILALALYFFIVKFLGFIMKAKEAAPPPPPTKDQELLTEIRDLLKQQVAGNGATT
jgi:large conductance mechanosensitive channel